MPRVRCAPCSWGTQGAATAVSETLPSRTSASCIPFHADRGMVKGLQPHQGAVLRLLSLLNCGHAGTALCASPHGKGAAGAAGKLGRGSLVCGAEQGTGRAAAKNRGQLGLQEWRGTEPDFLGGWWKRLVLCWSWRMASAGVLVCGGTPGTHPAWEVVTKPACQDAGIYAEASVTSVASSRVLQLNDCTFPLGNSCVRHPCSEQPNVFGAARTLGLKQKET